MSTNEGRLDSPVTRALDDAGIPYRTFRHTGPVHSLEQAAAERGQQPGQVIRSLVFRIPEKEYVMVLAAGSTQVSWSLLRRYLGVNRLTTATEDELRQVTGYPRGAVSPLGIPVPIRILVDRSVLAPEEISLGSGVAGTTVIMASQDLMTLLPGAEIGEYLESE